jgi:hypothetical protein
MSNTEITTLNPIYTSKLPWHIKYKLFPLYQLLYQPKQKRLTANRCKSFIFTRETYWIRTSDLLPVKQAL